MSHASEGRNDGDTDALSERQEAEEAQRALERAVADSSIAHWTFFMLGCAVLLPWNAIITAMPFFLSRLGESHLRPVFASYLVALMQLARLPTLLHATYSVKQVPKTPRIRRAGTALVILLALLYISTFITGVKPSLFFGFAIANGVLQSCINSYFQTALIAIASWFGPLAVQSMFSGQAAVAVIISLLQLLSAIESIRRTGSNFRLVSSDPFRDRSSGDRAASTFFLVMTAGMMAAIISHTYLTRMAIYKEASIEFEGKPAINDINEGTPLLHDQPLRATTDINPELSPVHRILRIIRTNWTYNLAIFLIFFVTLAVFPAITTAIPSIHSPDSKAVSHPLIFNAVHFLLFNLGDLVGRWLCRFSSLQIWSGCKLLAFSWLRILFVPLFLACNIQPAISNPPLINSDLAFFIILFLFGVTNGQIGSLCMMAAPSLEHNRQITKDDVDTAAVVASFCLASGLTLGGMANFGIRAIICRCNPFIN